jgi:hypothetical protein
MAGAEYRPAELTWVDRPDAGRPEPIQDLTGRAVHATGPVRADGEADVVLQDGTRLRARATEIVAEYLAGNPGRSWHRLQDGANALANRAHLCDRGVSVVCATRRGSVLYINFV